MQKPENIIFEGAKVRFTHFNGVEDDYNKKGDRNFTLELTPEQYEALRNQGFYVKENFPKNGGDPFYTMKIKCNWKDEYGIAPSVYMVTNGKAVRMSEATVKLLDDINILSVDAQISVGSKPWKDRTTGVEYWPAYADVLYCITDGSPRRKNDIFAGKYQIENSFYDGMEDIDTDKLPF